MATQNKVGTRRLHLVGSEQDRATAASARDDLATRQALAFAAKVAESDHAAVQASLDQMSGEQLRSLAIALAAHVNEARVGALAVDAAVNVRGEVTDVGPDMICAIAATVAAQSFGTTREAVLSADRHRPVTDARAVAMTAARRSGITLPAIGAYFGKDHTSVMYAQNKVALNPRLDAACARIIDQLEQHCVTPVAPAKADVGEEDAPTVTGGDSTTLQLAALEPHRDALSRLGDGETQRPGGFRAEVRADVRVPTGR